MTLSRRQLMELLDTFAEPAYVLDDDGEVLVANEAASRLGLCDAGPQRNGADAEHRRTTRLELEEGTGHLVVCSSTEPTTSAHRVLRQLAPSLQGVARLAARGWSDRQIAAELELSLYSVRTYMRRIYKRLGVSTRAQLVLRLSGTGANDGAPAGGARGDGGPDDGIST